MLKFYANKFASAVNTLGQARLDIDHTSHLDGQPFPEELTKTLIGQFEVLKSILKDLGMEMSLTTVNHILDRLWKNPRQDEEMKRLLWDINRRLIDELGTRFLFSLNADEAALYNSGPNPFGADVAAKLPDAVSGDIDEALKCLALGRATASVFHLMRVLESAVQTLGDTFGVALANTKMWAEILSACQTKIDSMHKQDAKRVAFSGIIAHLGNVRIAWRNEVMHPKATYTLEEARAVLDHSKLFLVELAKAL